MNIQLLLTKRKIISALLVCCFTCFCCIISLNSGTQIIDDDTPLATSNREAMFYIEDSESGNTTCIGDGLIKQSASEISNNTSEVAELVVSSPDYSAFIGNQMIIAWHTIKNEDGEYKVYGKFAPAKTEPTATDIEVATFADISNCKLIEGSTITTKGFYAENDGGGAEYTVSSTPYTYKIPNISVPLSNDLYANLIFSDTINVRHIGAKGDGNSDDYEYLNSIARAGFNLGIPSGSYYSSTRLLLSKDITICGESRENTSIIFKDLTANASYEKWNQRGLITFNNNIFHIENITLKYIADNSTEFTRVMEQSGTEGVLLSILRGTSITVNNCDFFVGGSAHPSITCMWMKSELEDVRNVSVSNCNFKNDTLATVGGCLWMSAHDNSSTCVSDVKITNCSFSKNGNDEALSFWGYNVKNVLVEKNNFEFYNSGGSNEVLIAFGMPNTKRAETLSNIQFKHNTININGESASAIKSQFITDQSTIEISDNVINGNIVSDGSDYFSCFGFNNGGTVSILNNTINLTGGNILSYMTYGSGGKVYSSDNTFTADDCSRTMLVRSPSSKYFDDASVDFNDDTFVFGGDTTVSEQPVVQCPASGTISFDNCTFDTSNCAIHELRYQILYNSKNEHSPNTLQISDCSLDGNLILKFTKYSDTQVDLSNSDFKSLSFIVPNNNECLSNLDISGTTYDKLRMNYKATTTKSLNNICNSLTESKP